MDERTMQRLARLALLEGASFTELVEIAGLDPARSFRGADLAGVDFGTCDLAGYDFTEADLSGARLDRASTKGAIFDDVVAAGTRWPELASPREPGLGQQLAPHLPFLRRYGRALTGSQKHGDAFVRATLEAIVADPADFPRDVDPRLGLYRTFQAIWSSAVMEEAEDGGADDPEGGRTRLFAVPPLSRVAALLVNMEGLAEEDAGFILGVDEDEVRMLVAEEAAEIDRRARAEVLIIEDELIIALDLETMVRDLGHSVTAIAATRSEAVAQARARRPGLILADIQLADDSSGIDAANDILAMFEVPVIFVTAFPERLLTGERPEPTFLITKPFQRSTVRALIAQALFFNEASLPA